MLKRCGLGLGLRAALTLARQLLLEAENVILHAREEMLRGLSDEQQQALTDLLQTVKANFSDALELNPAQAGEAVPVRELQ